MKWIRSSGTSFERHPAVGNLSRFSPFDPRLQLTLNTHWDERRIAKNSKGHLRRRNEQQNERRDSQNERYAAEIDSFGSHRPAFSRRALAWKGRRSFKFAAVARRQTGPPLLWVESMERFPFARPTLSAPATGRRFFPIAGALRTCASGNIRRCLQKRTRFEKRALVVVRGFYIPDRPVVACRLIVAPAIPVAAVAVVVIMVMMLSAAAGLSRSRKQRKGAHDRGHRKCE